MENVLQIEQRKIPLVFVFHKKNHFFEIIPPVLRLILLRAETINNLNQEGIKMKALTKKVLVILIALAVTVTLAYAGMKSENMVSWDEVFNHPALDALAIAYNASR